MTRLIDAAALIESVTKDEQLTRFEKIALVKFITQQPTKANISKLIIEVSKLETIPGEGLTPYVSYNEVLKILKGAM